MSSSPIPSLTELAFLASEPASPSLEILSLKSRAAADATASPLGLTLTPLLSEAECAELIAWAEATDGMSTPASERTDVRDTARFVFNSPGLAEAMWARMSQPDVLGLNDGFMTVVVAGDGDHDPSLGDGARVGQDGTWNAVGLNTRFRLCKYTPGGFFSPHYDAQYAPSSERVSFRTCMTYLNRVDDGGATHFLDDDGAELARDEDTGRFVAKNAAVVAAVVPTPGLALVFNHGLLHEGGVLGPDAPAKYILRTEVMYERVPGTAVELEPRKAQALELFKAASAAEAQGDMTAAVALYRRAYKLDPEVG